MASVGMVISLIPGLEAVGTALTFAGSLMAGMGSGAFIAAGATMGFASSWGRVMGAVKTRPTATAPRTGRHGAVMEARKKLRAEIEAQKEQQLPEPKGIREKIRVTREKIGRAKPWIISPGYQLYKTGRLGRFGGFVGKKVGGVGKKIGKRLGKSKYVRKGINFARDVRRKIYTSKVTRKGVGFAKRVYREGVVGTGVSVVRDVGKRIVEKYPKLEKVVTSKPAKWIRGKIGKGIGFMEEIEKAHREEIKEMWDMAKKKPKDFALEAALDIAVPGRFGYKVFKRTGTGKSIIGTVEKMARRAALEVRGVTLKGMLKKALKEGIALSIPGYNILRAGKGVRRFLRARYIQNGLKYVNSVKQGEIQFNMDDLKIALMNSGIPSEAIDSLRKLPDDLKIKNAEEMLAQQWHATVYNYEKEMAKAWKNAIPMSEVEKMRQEIIGKLSPYQANRDIYKLRKMGVSDDTIRKLGYKV